MRVVFLGNDRWSVPTLEALDDDDGIDVELVITNPPRPAGRGARLRPTPVAEAARDIAVRARDLAQESDRLTRRSFEVGSGTSLELVLSAGALRQAELQLVLREFQLQEAKVTAFLAEAACDW